MKCLKCQNDTFDKSMIFARTLDKEAKYRPNQDTFEILTCTKCHLMQWYDYGIISGEKKPEKDYEKSIYELPRLLEFKCFNCNSNTSKIERIEPLEKIVNAWEGEILLRLCTRCGLAELYQILLAYPGKGSSASRLSEKALLAKDFDCPVCKSKKVSQTGEVLFRESLSNRPAYQIQERDTPYLFATCKTCKYMMVFAGYLG